MKQVFNFTHKGKDYKAINLPELIDGYFVKTRLSNPNLFISTNGLWFNTIDRNTIDEGMFGTNPGILFDMTPQYLNSFNPRLLQRTLDFNVLKTTQQLTAIELQRMKSIIEKGRQQIMRWEQELTQKEHPILAILPFSNYFL